MAIAMTRYRFYRLVMRYCKQRDKSNVVQMAAVASGILVGNT